MNKTTSTNTDIINYKYFKDVSSDGFLSPLSFMGIIHGETLCQDSDGDDAEDEGDSRQ